jgi:uncharacterized glyoxalase superfamily protein PhnB
MAGSQWRASPILGVRRVRQSAEYYRDVLGFSLDPVDGVFQPPGSPDGVYAIVKRADAWIHFQIRRSDAPVLQRSPMERDAYIYVQDVAALHQELVKRGAKVLVAPQQTPYGLLEMVVEDPDGYRIAFGEAQ